MKDTVPDMMEKARIRTRDCFPGEWYGSFFVKLPSGMFATVIASAGQPEHWPFPGPPWEHVSVTVREAGDKPSTRCPTWEEMCFVKSLCFEPTECVIQFHPPQDDNVSYHPYCLHLWRPVGVDFPMPPKGTIA